MIITKDMLVTKGADPCLVCEFARFFPNGFDCNDQKTLQFDYEPNVMKLIGYTGLITHESTPYYYFRQNNYVNGLLHNLSNGNPAIVLLYNNNKLLRISYYVVGKLQNPSKYLPAEIQFNIDGTLYYRVFWENGKKKDPAHGVPAFAYYNKQGKYTHICHSK